MFARLLPLPVPVGLASRRPLVFPTFGGREDTQSCTRRLTLGLERRFTAFFEEGFEVMMMVGPGGILARE
jgi:hypothetical protein